MLCHPQIFLKLTFSKKPSRKYQSQKVWVHTSDFLFVLKMSSALYLFFTYIQVYFRIDFTMEANPMNPDKTDPKGAV